MGVQNSGKGWKAEPVFDDIAGHLVEVAKDRVEEVLEQVGLGETSVALHW